MRSYFFVFAFVGIFLLSGTAQSDETKVELSEVPKSGIDAVKTMFPDAKIEGAAKETDDDKTVFEVTLKQKGRTIDVTIGADGKIQVVEKEIAEKDLPTAVKKQLEAKYPKATYKIVEQVESMKDGKLVLDFFEVLLTTADKQSIEAQIAPDGKVKAEEKKKPEDKD